MTSQTSSATLLSAVTATTTSNGFRVGPMSKLSLVLTAASIATGNGVFTVDVSNDGSTWIAYNRLVDNVANSNVQTDTRVASKTLNSNSSVIVFFSQDDFFEYIRVTVTRTTDGAYTASLLMRQDG